MMDRSIYQPTQWTGPTVRLKLSIIEVDSPTWDATSSEGRADFENGI
jgi:hypothetical protein